MHHLLSVVLPAYNEEKRILPTLQAIEQTLREDATPFEILVVDDGSTDATADRISSLGKSVRLLRQPENRGKGKAVKRGVLAAEGDPILFCDADGATPFPEYRKLAQALAQAEVAIGSRSKRGAKILTRQPLQRELMGKLFNLAVQALFLPGIWDTQCGFKMFQRKAALAIFPHLQTSRFAFDVEVLAIAKKLGLKIAEVPVCWEDRAGSTVHPLRDGLQMLQDLIVLRRRLRHGLFQKER